MLSKDMKIRSEAAARGSLKAEGLRPSRKVQQQAKKYINGEITKRELHANVLRSVKAKLKES